MFQLALLLLAATSAPVASIALRGQEPSEVALREKEEEHGPSGTGNWVSGGRAVNYASGSTDDFVSACFASANFDPSKKCACNGKPKNRIEERMLRSKVSMAVSPWKTKVNGPLMADMWERHVLIDEAVHKMPGDFDQVVILAAGMDGRAYRESSGMKNAQEIFEVDLPESSKTKQALVQSCGLTPVNKAGNVNYLTWNAMDEHPFDFLAAHPKFKKGGRTLFISEQMAEYLDEDANKHWLQELSKLSSNPEDKLIFLALNWNPFWMTGAKSPKLNQEESWKSYMPSDKKKADEWMHATGWAKADGFDVTRSKYKLFMGVYKPHH